MIVPPSPDSHDAGSVRVINFSSYTAGVALDSNTEVMNSGDIEIISSGSGRVFLQVAVEVEKNGSWERAFRGERRIAPQLRGDIFIFNYFVDPEYGPTVQPPPVVVKTFFEVSPETLENP